MLLLIGQVHAILLGLLITLSHAWRPKGHLSLFGFRGGSTDERTSKAKPDATIGSNLPRELNLTVHDDILTADECEFLINLAQPLLEASKVGRPPKVEPSLRVSLSCKIPRLPYPELWSVEEKMARAAGVSLEYGEDLQIGAYQPGMYYGLHCDERPGGRPNGGGRLATALAYLNTLDPKLATGGETLFTGQRFNPYPDFPISEVRVSELNRLSNLPQDCAMVAPLQGRVITFRNMAPQGSSDKPTFIATSTHGACPVVGVEPHTDLTQRGSTKFVVQQWFGMGPFEINMCRHPHLICHLGLGVADAYGIDPAVDLGSRDGKPIAHLVQAKEVPFLIPNLKATHLYGTNAEVTWHKPDERNIIAERGLAMGFWVNRKSGQKLLQVGPYEWQVDKNQRLSLKINGGSPIDCQVDIPVNQWCHLSFVVAPGDNSKDLVLEIYKNLPGHAPQAPTNIPIHTVPDGALRNSSVEEYVRVGGGEETVDMMVCDLFVVNDKLLQGRGYAFAQAVVFYNPQQGI